MARKNRKKQEYISPGVALTGLCLEPFCQSIRFKTQVDPLENMNDPNSPDYNPDEQFYFES